MTVIKIFSVFLIIFFFGCKNSENNRCITTDNFKKDIPIVHGKLPLGYVNALEISDQLNLPNISNGYDSLQIRVWFPTEKDGNRMLLILVRTSEKWNMKLFKYLAEYPNRIPKIISVERIDARPRHSWEDIINGIVKIKILEVKDYRHIKNYNDNFTHTRYYGFEVASCTYYRYFQSAAPEENSTFPEAKKVLEFIELINSQIEY